MDVNNFDKQIDNVSYKGEIYSVRDNGAVIRHSKSDKPRKNDNTWTFGNKDTKTGYMLFAGERIHRIIAMGFYGNPPDDNYVVDHIDTNRCNNRPENLRWLTKLENAVFNTSTRKKIEFITGVDVFVFLQNPELYRDCFNAPNVSWMKTVSKEEATACLKHVKEFEKNDNYVSSNKGISGWIFKDNFKNIEFGLSNSHEEMIDNDLFESLTKNALQKNWRTPTEFVLCPSIITDTPLKDYSKNLSEGAVFAKNTYGESMINSWIISEDELFIIVLTQSSSSIKPWALAKIIFENNKFIHQSLGTFFEYDGALKQFTINQGLEWEGGDSIDDYC